ncbi:MAG: alanine racemase [Arenicella sp.]
MPKITASNSRGQVVIDRKALKHNLTKIRERCPESRLMAVIKADGYGHGMELVAQVLNDADEFAVSGQDELWRLRANGIDKPVTLLSAHFNLGELEQMLDQNVRPTIYDVSQIEILEQLSTNASMSVWLKVDTGMGRLGLLENQLTDALRRLGKIAAIKDISLMTHLANADNIDHPANAKQFALFNALKVNYPYRELSVLNSAGLVGFSDQAQSIVRSGIMLYGISPIAGTSASSLDLHPAMTFRSQLISVKQLAAGSAVGYESSYVLDHDSRIGIVACGYGDGYPRHAPSGTPVLVNGKLVPLVGRVSMDMLAVDLGDLAAKIGDQVTLWGEGNPIETVAAAAATIPYTLCTGILPRVQRVII